MSKIIRIAIYVVALSVLLSIVTYMLYLSHAQTSKFMGNYSDSISTATEYSMNDLNNYDEPIPMTAVYRELKSNIGSIKTLKWSYIAINPSGRKYVKDVPVIDFTTGGTDSDGNSLSAEEYRYYVLEQLKDSFAEKALFSAEEDENGMYDVVVKEVVPMDTNV